MNLHGAPFCGSSGPLMGAPLAAHLLGPHRENMHAESCNHLVARGMSILKQVRLLAASWGTHGMLTWMGNEFGQIDSVDMPRPANGFKQFSMSFALASDESSMHRCLHLFEVKLLAASWGTH